MGEDLNSLSRLLISSVAKERQQGIVLAVRGNHSQLLTKITEIAGSDPDPETRYLARKGLEKLGELARSETPEEDQFAAIGIEKLLQSTDPHARFAGLKKLLAEKSRTGRFMLLAALSTETVAQLKASMIIGVGHFHNPEDVAALAPFLKHEDSRIRANTVEAMAMISSEDAYRCIVAAMGDEDNRVKTNVVKALQSIGGPSLFELLKKMSQDDSLWMRSSAVFAFSKIKSPQSLVALAQVAQSDPDQTVRSKALAIIRREKDEGNPAAQVIMRKLELSRLNAEPAPPVVTQAEFEPGSDNEIIALLNSTEATKRYIALSRLGEGEFFKFSDGFLAAFSQEQDAFLVSMMLTLLREKKLTAAFSRVRVLLNHSDDRVRANAVEALAAIDSAQAGDYLLPMLRDKNGRVVANAIMGLHLANRIDVIAEIKGMLKQGREAFKHSALYVISQIREPFAVGLLERLISDHSPRVRDKAYDILQMYVNDRIAGSLRLQQDVEKQIELDKNREKFFENSLDATFSSLLKLIRAGEKLEEEQEKKLFERNPQSEKIAMLQLAEKCLLNKLADSRTMASIQAIDDELASIDQLISKSREQAAESVKAVDECARNMSEEQLMNIERKSLLARREALMSFFAFEFYSGRHQLDSKNASLMRVELGRVEGSICSYIPEKRFSMLPHDESVVSEIFDIAMRLYQKHVWKFSIMTLIKFSRWLIIMFGLGVVIGLCKGVSPVVAVIVMIVAVPYVAYKTLGLLVEWKINVALMVDDYIHGRESVKEAMNEKVAALHGKVFASSLKKHLLLGVWVVIGLMVSGTIASAGAVTGEFNLLSSLANLLAALLAIFIIASAYFKYLLVEPAAIFVPEEDPFAMAEKIYNKDKVKITTLFIFSTFVMTIVTGTSKEVLTFLMPVLPAKITNFLVIGLTLVSDLCLMPIVFATVIVFILMRLRKMGLI